MAEKEERILILTGNKDNYPAWNYSRGPLYLDEEYYDGISRTEAIERMAKAFVEYEKTNNPNACEWTDLKERAKDIYRERAEAALNALLGE